MVWQICLFVFLTISCSDGQHISSSTFEHIQRAIEKLEIDFNTSHSDVARGEPVFIDKLMSSRWSQTKERKILLAQIISMYHTMLSNISKSQSSEHIRDLKEALKDYERKYSEYLEQAKDLIKLSKVSMDDSKIQRKAAAEIFQVLQQVNVEENRRKRRRRQNPQVQKGYRPSFRA
ncbi:interferon gamma-like [Varanus komodoensis]|uniref:interferon gamma-like n=1 Tax=Varanus komodoensis TaxID=61221 RepID=UPI001CF78A6F|nr:interferon gamma-like [Varanus komodoensis]